MPPLCSFPSPLLKACLPHAHGTAAILLLLASSYPTPAADPLSPPPNASTSLLEGYQNAHALCQSCHLFPEPEWLDSKTWTRHALRRMAPLLGVGRLNLEKRPDGVILKESGIFPDHPLITEAQWRSIVDYYAIQAPETPLPQPPKDPVRPNTPFFKPLPHTYNSPSPMTTLVQWDPLRKKNMGGQWHRILPRPTLHPR